MNSRTSQISRREMVGLVAGSSVAAAAAGPRPNVLWITCEDIGPHLRACGDGYSITPHLDRLAHRGSIYMNAWSNAPVCAPARTTIISGLYPPSTGSEHMRSMTRLPDAFKMFPCYLREAGYYCTNNVKEDYNLEKTPGTWDESSDKAHWRKRAHGQPFFSVFNLMITHESQIRTRPHTFLHDPAKARVPAYHPDTIEVRQDWAQYYDNITTMDGQAGRILADLENDSLADDTIVFFYGDHGSGMPRSKRWPYNSGLNVSIVAAIPDKFRHLAGADYVPAKKNRRLVGFVDLAPTMLSLAGIKPPAWYQGHAFLGPHATPPRQYSFGFRGRMDERIDCVRSVRDSRYVYTRNYMPHKIYGQHLAYMWETPTTRVWERLYREGKLKPPQTYFWEPKPPEELYDLDADRDEVNNLAADPTHRPALERLRAAHREHESRIRDIGLLPEAEMHARSQGSTPYETGHDDRRYPFARVFAAAELAAARDKEAIPRLATLLKDADSGVRYWAALGLLIRGESQLLKPVLSDSSPSVRIVAGEALGDREVLLQLGNAVENNAYIATQALNALDALGPQSEEIRQRVRALPREDPKAPDRVKSEYVTRLIAAIVDASENTRK